MKQDLMTLCVLMTIGLESLYVFNKEETMSTQRPMRFNNCDYNGLAHEWAYNHERDLRTGCDRMHTRGNTLYSYSTAIAYKIVDKQVLLLAREGFSNTTRKQKSRLRSAFTHWEIIYVNSDNIPEYDVSLKRLLKKEVEECQNTLTRLLSDAKPDQKGVLKLISDRQDFCDRYSTLHDLCLFVDETLFNTEADLFKLYTDKFREILDYNNERVERREQARKERERKAAEELAKRYDDAVKRFNQELGCPVKEAKYSKLI